MRARLPWLVTASLAASVVVIFGSTIDSLWFLAAIMPIVAGHGRKFGHAVVGCHRAPDRALQRSARAAPRRGREGGAGGTGERPRARVARLRGLLDRRPHDLGGEPAPALVGAVRALGNILIAASMGALIPTVLHRMGVDPAIAWSVFLTAFSDGSDFPCCTGSRRPCRSDRASRLATASRTADRRGAPRPGSHGGRSGAEGRIDLGIGAGRKECAPAAQEVKSVELHGAALGALAQDPEICHPK